MLETITTIKDERIVLARALKSLKGRLEHGKVLLEGEEILDWAIEHAIHVEYVLVSDKSSSKTIQKYLSQGLEVFAVSEGILKKAADTNYVIPVVAVGRIPSGAQDHADFVVVLDSVKDSGNIGTIVRTCQAFGIRDIVSTTPDFDLYQRKTIEASRGCAFATHVERFDNPKATVAWLKKHGYQIVATSPKGDELQSLVEIGRQPVALVVGNETTGISREFEEHADSLIQIPMYHVMESLNVGVATGISVYELKLKQVLTMIEERIKSTLGRELNVAGTLVWRALDAELAKVTGLSSQQVVFMMVLKCDRKMDVKDMCKQFGVLENEVEEFLTPMVKSGLITLATDVRMTRAGEEMLAKLWPVVERAEGKILSGFSAEQSSALMAQLRLVQDNCVKLMNGERG
jgi:RNA methyltransferase, TrmH family